MNLQDLKKVYETFENLNEKEQWEWLLKTDLKPFFNIGLDNDTTSICFDCDEEADYLMYFKSDIGNRQGVEYLLEFIGCRYYDK